LSSDDKTGHHPTELITLFDKLTLPPNAMNNTKAIEIKLPGKNPTTVFVHALRTIVFQKTDDKAVFDDMVVIGIEGWAKPYVYEGNDALSVYTKLVAMFDVAKLDI
jgi:hypothetical protein